MRPSRFFPLAACLSACASPHGRVPLSLPELPSAVTVELTEHWYAVRGRTVAGITECLARDAPERAGTHAWALTRWRVAWNGTPEPHDGGCRIADLDVRVQVEMTLPRWTEREHAGDRARLTWDDFYNAILVHEKGHRNIALQAGVALAHALDTLQAPTCATMMEAASATARPILARHRDADRAYDARTRTGLVQGAAWPP